MPKQVMFECPHCARPVHFEDGTEEALCPSCDAHFKLDLHEGEVNPLRSTVTTVIITLFLAAVIALIIVRMFPSDMDPQFDTRGDTVESEFHF